MEAGFSYLEGCGTKNPIFLLGVPWKSLLATCHATHTQHGSFLLQNQQGREIIVATQFTALHNLIVNM